MKYTRITEYNILTKQNTTPNELGQLEKVARQRTKDKGGQRFATGPSEAVLAYTLPAA